MSSSVSFPAESWATKLGGALSAVTVAHGRLFVASIDAHAVHALDAETGELACEVILNSASLRDSYEEYVEDATALGKEL